MAKVCQLFSGSSGNSTYIGSSGGGILIDIGVSARRMTGALADIGVEPSQIQGIFLTHEHKDHVAGLRVFAGKHHIPVFGSEGTLIAVERAGMLTDCFDAYILDLPQLAIGNFGVSCFSTSHDSAESCGYRVELPDGRTVAVCTDLGFVSQGVREGITGCDAIVLESNHDEEMVKTGPYPYYLKERILSRRGHLSNRACSAELPQLVQNGTTRFILSHLSRENNTPMQARQTAMSAFYEYDMKENRDFLLTIAPPCGGSPVLL